MLSFGERNRHGMSYGYDVVSEDEIENIIINVRKEITEKYINWEYRGDFHKFKVNVHNEEGYPLKLVGTYSVKTSFFSFALLLSNRRIRGLDCGSKRHHNPDCDKIKGVHKHKWTDSHQDREAYIPKDIDCSDVIKAFEAFLKECNISFSGRLLKPVTLRNFH